jgi:NADH-quinone oxidoreductase subunit M
MGLLDDKLLTIITFFPLVTALGLLATSVLGAFLGTRGLPAPLWRAVAVASTTLNFLLSLRLFFSFDPVSTGFQFIEYAPWLPAYGINYFVGIDGISLFLIVLTTFLMPIILVASWNDIASRVKSYVFFMLFLETGMLGAFVCLNVFAFYVFWELMLVPMYFIIGIWGGPQRIYAAVKFFLFTMFGSLFMLVAMISVYFLAFEQTGTLNFDLVNAPGIEAKALFDITVPVAGEDVWWKTQTWLFAAFALAFAIKVPMVPFHTWLPDAHVEAPTAGSVILAGVLLKMGTYGFLRFALPLFPVAAVAYAPWVLALGLVGIVYGSLVAMVQSDIKKLVAYSSVAHMGFVMLGIFAFNVEGLAGGVLQMVNHGVSTGALFLLVGLLYERRHTRQISDFGGVAKPMPVYAAFFGIVTMSSIGLPLLNGFVGEFLILVGVFLDRPLVAVVATSGVVLAAAYMLWMYRRVMFGPVEHAENRSLIDLSLREKGVMFAMLIPIFWIGIYPEPFLRRIEPSVIELLRQVDVSDQRAVEAAEGPAEEPAGAEATSAEEPAGAAPPPAAERSAEAPERMPAEAPPATAADGQEEP